MTEFRVEFRTLKDPEFLLPIERRLMPTKEDIDLLRKDGLQAAHLPKSLMCTVKTVPYKHQIEAYLIGLYYSGAALLMEPGTGKTLSAIGIIGRRFLAQELKRVLVVCPKSVIPNWAKEFKKHAAYPVRGVLMDGNGEEKREIIKGWRDTDHVQVIVINYESVRILAKEMMKWKPDMIVCDESQKIKSPRAKQSKALHTLGSLSKFKLILTGTPITKSPLDVWSQYRFIDSSIFGKNYKSFQNQYAVMGGYGGFEVKRFKNQEELAKKTHKIAYRVKIDDCLDMPPIINQVLYCDLDNTSRKVYDSMEKDFLIKFLGGDSVKAPIMLTQLQKCHQITGGFLHRSGDVVHVGAEKLNLLTEFLEDYPKNKKLVIFAQWVPELKAIGDLIKQTGRSVELFYGKTKITDRGRIVQEFQESNLDVVVVQMSTGGTGIDLYAADTAVFYSVNHNYGDYTQCCSRLRRIGQTSDRIRYIHLAAKNTVDSDIMEALADKKSLADAIVDRFRKLHPGG